MKISLPSRDSLSDYYKTYLKYISEDDLFKCLIEQRTDLEKFLATISIEKESFQYASGKWMLKEVAGHLCDTERILSYRALRTARNDKLPLQGFDENEYTLQSNYKVRSLKNITEEFLAVRQSTILLFQNITHHWESMSYFWTLIIMLVGVGIYTMGWYGGDENQKRSGVRVIRVGVIMFIIFGTFFEMIFSSFSNMIFPILLILLGDYLVVSRSGLIGGKKNDSTDSIPPVS